jgi:hypothetical protein
MPKQAAKQNKRLKVGRACYTCRAKKIKVQAQPIDAKYIS